MQAQNEKTLYELFRVSIWIKILGSLGEMLAGTVIALIPSTFVLQAALYFSQGDTSTDTDDFLAQTIMHVAHLFVTSNALLIGFYLFMRGFVQLLLAIALFRNKLWAYPSLFFVLLVLVITQIFAIYQSHSIATIIITFVDLITMYLVWHEYTIAREALTKV